MRPTRVRATMIAFLIEFRRHWKYIKHFSKYCLTLKQKGISFHIKLKFREGISQTTVGGINKM